MHTRTHVCTHIQTPKPANLHTHTYTRMHVHTYTHTHAHTRQHTHPHEYTHIEHTHSSPLSTAHTNTYTHTIHIQKPKVWVLKQEAARRHLMQEATMCLLLCLLAWPFEGLESYYIWISHENSSHGISSIHCTYTYICTLTIYTPARMTIIPRSIISQRWHIHMCGMSHSYMRHATFIRVPWLDGSIWSHCLFSAVFVSLAGDPKPRKENGQGLIVFVLIQILECFIMRGEKTVSIRTGRAAIYLILTNFNLLDTSHFNLLKSGSFQLESTKYSQISIHYQF